MEHPLDTAGSFLEANLIWILILFLVVVAFVGAVWFFLAVFREQREQ